MSPTRPAHLLPLLCLIAPPLLALPPEKDEAVLAAVKGVQEALAKGDADALRVAAEKGQKLRDTRDDKQLQPLVKALSKGIDHKQRPCVVACIEALGALRCAESTAAFAPLLAPPPKLSEEDAALHAAALRAAGRIRDEKSKGALLRAVEHPVPAIAIAGAEGLSGYKGQEQKPRMALARDAIALLALVEKRAAAAPTDEAREALQPLHAALNASICELTRNPAPTKHAEWVAWLKAEAKAPR